MDQELELKRIAYSAPNHGGFDLVVADTIVLRALRLRIRLSYRLPSGHTCPFDVVQVARLLPDAVAKQEERFGVVSAADQY